MKLALPLAAVVALSACSTTTWSIAEPTEEQRAIAFAACAEDYTLLRALLAERGGSISLPVGAARETYCEVRGNRIAGLVVE